MTNYNKKNCEYSFIFSFIKMSVECFLQQFHNEEEHRMLSGFCGVFPVDLVEKLFQENFSSYCPKTFHKLR